MNLVKKLTGTIVFTLTLALYILTVCPTVFVGDSGEMITAAYYMGIPHPPGYPLFCLLGKLLTFLPLGTIALRVNLLAAIFGAVTVFMLYKLLSTFTAKFQAGQETLTTQAYALNTARRLLPAALALLFACSITFWSQALIAKGSLYTINAFLIVTILYLLYTRSEYFSTSMVFLIAFLNGLGLANHNTIAPLSLFFLLFVILSSKTFKKGALNTLLYLIVSGFTAMAVYLYLPLRSAANPVIDWGHPVINWGLQIEGYYPFLNHILRKQYTVFADSPRSLLLFYQQTAHYFFALISQLTAIFFVLALPGIYACYKFSRKFFLLLLSIFILTGFGFLVMSNPMMNAIDKYTIEVFFIPSYMVLAIWALFGILFIFSKASSGKAVIALVLTFFLALTLLIKTNYPENNRSNNYICHDYGANILRSPSLGSVLFVSGDNATFSTAYFKMVEKARPDLLVYDDYGRIFKNIYGEDFLYMGAGVYSKRVSEVQRSIVNSSEFPVYGTLGGNIFNMDDFRKESEGLVYRVKTTRNPPLQNRFLGLVKRGLEDKDLLRDYWCREIAAGYYMIEGDRLFAAKNPEAAKKNYKKAAEIGKDCSNIISMLGLAFGKFSMDESLALYKGAENSALRSPEVLNNLGVVYFKKGLFDESIAAYEEVVKMDKNYYKAYFNIGVSYNAKGDLNKAIEYFQKAVEKNPTYVDAFYGLANCSFYKKDFEKALSYYLKTTEINPEFTIGYNGAAASLHSQGKYKEAIKYYEKAVSIRPDYAEGYGNMAGAYLALNDRENALKTVKTGLKQIPGDPTLTRLLKTLGNN